MTEAAASAPTPGQSLAPARAQTQAQQRAQSSEKTTFGNQTPAHSARQVAEQVCAACHGVDGNSPAPYRPSLAQQNSAYLYSQLMQFKAQGGQRASGVMGAIAVHMSPAEMQSMAEYFAQQTLKPGPPRNSPLAKRGEAIYFGGIAGKNVPACASCHGVRAEGLAPAFPRLAGQHAQYIAAQLREFRSGRRAGDLRMMMRDISNKLSDREMDAVAQYVASVR